MSCFRNLGGLNSCGQGRVDYVSIWQTSSAGRLFGFAAFAEDIEGVVLSACGDDARRELGREEKGMEMFCSSENERVR